MFERVLSDLLRPLLPTRVTLPGGRGPEGDWDPDCIWENGVPYPNSSSEDEYNDDQDAWFAKHEFRIPDGKPKYNGELKVMNNRISLKGRTLQVLVKLASIILTPDRPEYPDGRWHVEGMRNEMIVSSFIYYFDSENITESRLLFRRATSEPDVHGRDDSLCVKVLYDMQRESPCVQGVGDVITKTHRCVAFPNLYQHQIQPFRLEDPTKPGHRKVLVFFLVDPTQRVVSATDVPPQQSEWVTEVMRHAGPNSPLSKLPLEVLTMISDENEWVMSRLEAEQYREEMISERDVAGEENDRTYFGRRISHRLFCMD